MITLITGVPGSGKTLSVVADLAKKVKKEWAGRKIFTHGIRDLTIPTEPIPDGYTINDLHVWANLPENHGSVIIIDEAQNIFPPRSAGSKAPEIVEWLHVHRHSGIDLILITQMPGRIDKQVRDLVGAHYHIHKNPLGLRMRYFWDYCENNPKTGMKNARPEVYKLDKSAFKLYKSAEVHTKVETPKSRVLWVIPIGILCFCLFGWLGFKTLSSLGGVDSVDSVDLAASDVSASSVNAAVSSASVSAGQKLGANIGQQQNRSLTEEMFKPTVEGKVESKPIYDTVRKVQQFEYPVACISGGKSGCSCYTAQGTAIAEIDKKTCNSYVQNGLPFNPYKSENRQTAAAPAPAPSSAPSQVAVMGGESPQNLMYDGYVEAGKQFHQRGGVVGGGS